MLTRTTKPLATKADASAVERVITHIRDGIRDGSLVPGQRLVEADLQSALRVSRGPIREAIRRLAAERVVEVERYKGARVRRITAAEIKAIYEIREVLEGLAARLAAQNYEAGDTRLRTLQQRFDQSFDGTARSYLRYNARFHEIIVEMSGNAELRQLVENLQVPSFILLVHVLVDARSIARARAEHRPIVAAIRRKDAAAAERAMKSHIRNTLRFVMREAKARLDLS